MGCAVSSALAEKVEALSSTPFFLQLDQEQLEHFAAFFEVRKYPSHTRVFSEGEKGGEFFVIVSGEVDITALDADRHDQFLSAKKKGDFFGEQGVLNEGHKRTATVTTTDECVMLVINAKRFVRFLKENDESMKDAMKEIMGERMVNALQKIDFLSGISEWKLHLLGNLFRYRTVEKDDIVFEEGDLGRQLFIISKGKVQVTAKAEDGSIVPFENLSEGRYFGEIALMLDMPRTATVTAETRCLLLVLSAEDFRNFLHVVPDLKEKFEKVVKDRTAEHFRKFKVPFFKTIPQDRFKELADLCELKRIDPGAVVFQEGDPGSEFYLVVYGELQVIKNNGIVGVLKAGRYFGEIALVTDSPRTATVAASTRSILLSISKEKFKAFFSSNPEAYADFAIKLSRYEVPLVSILVHRVGRKYFRMHLESEYSVENLTFWDEAVAFEQLTALSPSELYDRASNIIQRYISNDAEEQVNIQSSVREAVIANFNNHEQQPIDHLLFKDAKAEILKLMSSDSYKRFKESDLFRKLLKEVGSYEDKPIDLEEMKLLDEEKEREKEYQSTTGATATSIPYVPGYSSAQSSLRKSPRKLNERERESSVGSLKESNPQTVPEERSVGLESGGFGNSDYKSPTSNGKRSIKAKK